MPNDDSDKDVLKNTALEVQLVLRLPEGQLTHEYEDYESLKKRVLPVIRQMLDNDFNSLLNLLYRIDVNEDKLKKILTFGNPENIAGDITDLILHREIQKVKTRKQYRKKPTG